MNKIFQAKKQKILSQLSLSDEVYSDASPKGSVDKPILEIVKQINAIDSLVTTSSCSGRIAVYLEGVKDSSVSRVNDDLKEQDQEKEKEEEKEEVDNESESRESSKQGKGGGEWLFVSHYPLPLSFFSNSVESSSDRKHIISRLLSHPINEIQASPAGADNSRLSPSRKVHVEAKPSNVDWKTSRVVHFKFEPLILHVLCADVSSAKKLLVAAQIAGFRESGAMSLPDQPRLSTYDISSFASNIRNANDSSVVQNGSGNIARNGDTIHSDEENKPDSMERNGGIKSNSDHNVTKINDDSKTPMEARRGLSKEAYRAQKKSQSFKNEKRKLQKGNADESVIVAIRTMGLGIDTAIAYISTPESLRGNDDEGENMEINMMVSEDYLLSLARLGNDRFEINEERKTRLQKGIDAAFGEE